MALTGVLFDLFSKRFDKDEMIRRLSSNPSDFQEAIQISLSNAAPQNWRAVWMLEHSARRNDPRILPFIDGYLQKLPNQSDGYQRELLKLLQKMKLSEEQEGRFFDACMTIWESVGKIPSVRCFALKYIVKTAKKYPELIAEISFVLQDHYAESLSPGIYKTFERLKNELRLSAMN